jgi:hypothetical protein
MLFPYSTFLAIQILLKNKLKIIFNIYKKWKTIQIFFINYENLSSPSTLIFKTKVQKIPKVQMEYFQDLIVDPNITHKKKKRIFWLGTLW